MKRRFLISLTVVMAIPAAGFVIGSMMPADHVARMSIDLTSPPDRVWSLISDFEGSRRWRTDITGVEMRLVDPPILLDGAPPPSPNGQIRFVETSSQGDIEFIVEVQDPPRRQVVRIVDIGQPFGGTWTWEIEPAGAGSRLTITENGFVKAPLFRVMGAIFFSPTATIEAYERALAKALGESAEPKELR